MTWEERTLHSVITCSCSCTWNKQEYVQATVIIMLASPSTCFCFQKAASISDETEVAAGTCSTRHSNRVSFTSFSCLAFNMSKNTGMQLRSWKWADGWPLPVTIVVQAIEDYWHSAIFFSECVCANICLYWVTANLILPLLCVHLD